MQEVRAKHAFTHGPGWRTAHASSIDEKGLIVKSKATSAPPRAGTTGIHICNHIFAEWSQTTQPRLSQHFDGGFHGAYSTSRV